MDVSEIILNYKKLVAKEYHGVPPIFSIIRKNHSSLAWQIEKNGGYLRFKNLAGFSAIERKSPNYWTLDRIKEHVSSIVKNKQFPTIEMIQTNFGCGITKAISRIGMKKLASIMGYELRSYFTCSDGHYAQSSYEYLFDEFLSHHKIPHEVGGLICEDHNFRYDFKIGSTYVEIWGYKSETYTEKRIKKEKLYKDLNLNLVSLEAEWFKKLSIDNVFNDIIKTAECLPLTAVFPIENYIHHTKYWNYQNTLAEFNNLKSKIGCNPNTKHISTIRGLRDAVHKHGGLHHFNNTKKKIWNDETICEFLKQISSSLGHFPTCTELRKMGHTGLLTAVFQHGKINKFRTILGYNVLKKSNNYWTDEIILNNLRSLRHQLGRILKTTDLDKSTSSAISNKGKNLKYFQDQFRDCVEKTQ